MDMPAVRNWNFNTGKFEWKQPTSTYARMNRKVKEFTWKKELEFTTIFKESLAGNETPMTLKLLTACKAISTCANTVQVGAQVAKAAVAHHHFWSGAILSHGRKYSRWQHNGNRAAAGGFAIVKIGNEKPEGTVSSDNCWVRMGWFRRQVITEWTKIITSDHVRLEDDALYVCHECREGSWVLRLANALITWVGWIMNYLSRQQGIWTVKRKLAKDKNFEYVEVNSWSQTR